MNLEISLVPHVGKKFSRRLGIEVDVDFGQFKIVGGGEDYKKATGRDGVWLGLVGKEPGMPINWLPAANEFPPAVLAKMAESVQAKLGQSRPVNNPPSAEVMNAPPPVAADQDTAGSDENL